MTNNEKVFGFIATTLTVLAAAGCNNDLPVASHLERTRVIGARVTVAADPGRAEVLPGESASVEWIVAGPRPSATLDWAFALCRAGQGACVDAPAVAGTGSGLPVVVPFQTPEAAALEGGLLPLLFGEVCADGTLGIDATGTAPTCTGPNASGSTARFEVPVRLDGGMPNRQPNLGNDVIELDGATWAPSPPSLLAGDACDASTGLPVVAATAQGASELKRPGHRPPRRSPPAMRATLRRGSPSSPPPPTALTSSSTPFAWSATATTGKASRRRAHRRRPSRSCNFRTSPPWGNSRARMRRSSPTTPVPMRTSR